MSMKLRLFLLIGTSVLTVMIISLVNYLGNTRMEAAMLDGEVSMAALGNHLQADMMHDALRADVLSAMLFGLGKSNSSRDEVQASLKEHAALFRKVVSDNLQLPLTEAIKAELSRIKPSLDAYISAASGLSGWPSTARTARSKSWAHFPVPSRNWRGRCRA